MAHIEILEMINNNPWIPQKNIWENGWKDAKALKSLRISKLVMRRPAKQTWEYRITDAGKEYLKELRRMYNSAKYQPSEGTA